MAIMSSSYIFPSLKRIPIAQVNTTADMSQEFIFYRERHTA